MMNKTLNIQLLLTGDELMSGDILDSNSAMIAQELKNLGLELTKKTTVGDNLELLTAEINAISQQADILIINGGLGPTIDDLTALALGKATSQALEQHPQAVEQIKAWCEKRNSPLNEPNLKQAYLPKGCTIIPNKNGSAPGFIVSHQQCDIYCTPGVPHELKSMLLEHMIPAIAKLVPSNTVSDTIRLQVFGLGESSLQKTINEQLPDWPDDIEIGFRAGIPLLEVKLTCRSKQALQQKELWLVKLKSLLGDHYIETVQGSPKALAEHTLFLLQQSNYQISCAESCTGGLIASLLTNISGSSKSFEAGYVTYSNAMKIDMLSVKPELIEQHGAVSQQVVLAMAKGALVRSKSDLAIAVSGIAGPDGGSEEKPVGTVWIAWGSKEHLQSQCLLLPLSRKYFQQYVAHIALDLIRRRLLNSTETPNYVIERGV
ncbi:CinA family nicotinamide mononucleotide deamidase-related protein [Litorilituus lipolyticus]|nr:CinA family nicotinamide mononucleotide deamidase-related protein [Litorilituus lipolyticus]